MSNMRLQRKLILMMLIFVVAVLLAASLYIHHVRASFVDATTTMIDSGQVTLRSLDSLIAHSNGDNEVNSIVHDCNAANRAQFDTLLGKLSQLHGNDLTTIHQLFNECSNFYSMRQSVMVLKLQNAFTSYNNDIKLLSLADHRKSLNAYQAAEWSTLVADEKKRADLTLSLVDMQGKIIQALIQNKSITSLDMQALLANAQEIRDTLSLLSTQVASQRNGLRVP